MFGKPACARHAAMLFRCRSLRSLGHQMMSGVWLAKCTTCWPVPLPASTHVAGFAGEEFLQHRPDRLMVAVERRRIEPAVGFDRPAILAEFHHIFSHVSLAKIAVA